MSVFHILQPGGAASSFGPSRICTDPYSQVICVLSYYGSKMISSIGGAVVSIRKWLATEQKNRSNVQPPAQRKLKIFKWKVSLRWAITSVSILVLIVTLSLFIGSQLTTSQFIPGPTDDGYNNPLKALSWSPNGKQIAVATFDGIYLWDISAKHRILIYPSSDSGIDTVTWSPNGDLIAFGGSSTPIQIWNVTTGKLNSLTSVPHSGLNVVTWAPNGKYIAFAGDNDKVEVYSFTTKKVIFENTNPAPVTALSWSSDSKRIACGDFEGTIHIIDITSGEDILRPFLAYNNPVLSLQWSPSDSLLASVGDKDAHVQIWDPTKNYPENQVSSINNPGGWWVNGIAWSPYDNEIASVDYGGTLRIWNALNSDNVVTFTDNSECARTNVVLSAITWSSDGNSLAFGHEVNNSGDCMVSSLKVVILCKSWCFMPLTLNTLFGVEP